MKGRQNRWLTARGINTDSPHVVFTGRHNLNAKTLSKILSEELTRTMNLSAEALAGGSFKKNAIGIRSVFTHDSKGTGKPSPVSKPPGVDTGTLRRSFRTRPARKFRDAIRVAAGSDVLYGKRHEFGIGTPQRPFMRQGMRSAGPYIRNLFGMLGSKIKSRAKMEAGPIK